MVVIPFKALKGSPLGKPSIFLKGLFINAIFRCWLRYQRGRQRKSQDQETSSPPHDRSVRIPSAFCGIYGLRPSSNRIPHTGCINSMEGQDSLPSILGPMSNSLAGIKTFIHAVVSEQLWLKDPLAVRKPWSEDEYMLVEHGGGKGLCFAVMWDNGIIRPHPPVIRGFGGDKEGVTFGWTSRWAFHFYSQSKKKMCF